MDLQVSLPVVSPLLVLPGLLRLFPAEQALRLSRQLAAPSLAAQASRQDRASQ